MVGSYKPETKNTNRSLVLGGIQPMRILGFQELGAVLNIGFWVSEDGEPMRVHDS